MDKAEKITFINSLMDGLKQDILDKVDRMPEEWDGWEIRQYIKDKTSEVIWAGTESRARYCKYYNEVLLRGL